MRDFNDQNTVQTTYDEAEGSVKIIGYMQTLL